MQVALAPGRVAEEGATDEYNKTRGHTKKGEEGKNLFLVLFSSIFYVAKGVCDSFYHTEGLTSTARM